MNQALKNTNIGKRLTGSNPGGITSLNDKTVRNDFFRGSCSLFHLLTFYFIVLSFQSANAQLNPVFLKQYTEQNGVPGAQVNSILPDHFGFIWLGTINGLAVYDGYEFKRFFNDPNDTASMEGLVIWSVYEDSKKRIWVSTGQSHLNRYNPVTKKFKRYNIDNLIDQPSTIEVDVAVMSEHSSGRIYLGVSTQYGQEIDGALLYYDESDDTIKRFGTKSDPQIQNIIRLENDAEGNTWILSYSGFFKIDRSNTLTRVNTFDKYFTAGEYPTDFAFGESSNLWIISSRGKLLEINLADSTATARLSLKLLKNNGRNCIKIDSQQRIWIGTNSGIVRFHIPSSTTESFAHGLGNPLENTVINKIVVDSFGTAWIGTDDKGLFKYEERTLFKSIKHANKEKDSLAPGWVSLISGFTGNKASIASGDGRTSGVKILDPETGKLVSISSTPFFRGTAFVTSLYFDPSGELLIATSQGVWRLSVAAGKMRAFHDTSYPKDVVINRFYSDVDGNLWLATMNGLYKRSKSSSQYKRYDLGRLNGSNASSNEITMAVESSIGGLWLTTNNGLFFYDKATDSVARHGFDKTQGDVFVSQDINSLYESNDTTVWVGGWQGGLSRYNPRTKKIKTYTRNDGLPSMSVQAILPDDKTNSLWLSTFDGISLFKTDKEQFVNFDISDGIQGQLFADGSVYRTADNYFLFGGSNGVTFFNPDNILRSSTIPKVFLTDLKVFNKSVLPGEKSILKKPIYETSEIVLAHNQANISLDFIALHYSDPSKNKYLYKLENYDQDWREAGSQHTAYYSGLEAGTYNFIVKASNNNGVWNEAGARLKIVVLKPWWKTGWAYAGYSLLLLVFLLLFNKYMRNRLINQERERNRAKELEQAKEIQKAYHNLGEAHEALKATQAQLIQSEKMASLGELTAGIAHEIQNPLNFINNFSDVSKELLIEMETALNNGNDEEAKQIANDVKENLEKVIHHGKRADSIVKGMLQHSRGNSGIKEPVDLNGMADEYLRLAYQGLRAKEKSFNSNFETDFDPAVINVQVVPQDIGRVLLNVYNNAFYAVYDKQKTASKDYTPLVQVSTRKKDNTVEVTVRDNGKGIPEKVAEKIFQPFFTTKPTGQGTGLGLSLAYDIVKSHGGTITVHSSPGEGATFVITLPV
ncbi:two-component regulator propeller domain-containing protein [Pollutibacter soli]|uniref:sensor histidine kinase n=1 Tax=Pollutibacter soli TaxID=3034157 RepID=UPI0030134020